MRNFLAVVCAIACFGAFASDRFAYLNPYETPPVQWTREVPPPGAAPAPAPLALDLTSFHETFRKEGVVKAYFGIGYEAYRPTYARNLFAMLQQVAAQERLPLRNFTLNNTHTLITFRNVKSGVKFELTLGNERNAFQKSFADHAIVLYHGHSRYGRGPAFRSFTNYFRMGDVFKTIEVDTRNPYFRNEPMQLTTEYPPVTANIGPYQYRGQRLDSSYLPNDAFTKNIPGEDVDLINTGFRPGKQLLWFYSCSNVLYFKKPLRKRFPDATEKPMFGTTVEGMWSEKPAAIFLAMVAGEEKSSQRIVDLQNATGDCKNCFTVY